MAEAASEIDYKDILRRYIRHVTDCEGDDMIGQVVLRSDPTYTHERLSVRFSEEEALELSRLADQAE